MNTREVVLCLLRSGLWGSHFDIPAEVDWSAVYAELKSQSVAGLVDQALMQHCPDSALKRAWSLDILHLLNSNEQNLFGQDNLLALLKEHGIPAAILKGAASAVLYPQPERRTLGDVDFLVPADRFDDALALLQVNGFYQKSDITQRSCEVAFVKDRVVFELHRSLNIADRVGADDVKRYTTEGLAHLEHHTINGYVFPTLPVLVNGLVLISHIRQHLAEGLGLRQIIDWMMYVNRYLDDKTWQDSFQMAVRECELEMLAISVTRMCQMYLGLSGEITWCATADDSACASLMDYIFERGNFGRKIEQTERVTQKIMTKKNYLWNMLIHLQRNGMERRDIVKKHPVLRPFAWAIQIGHYVKQTFKRGHVVKALQDDRTKARQLRKMLDALGISD